MYCTNCGSKLPEGARFCGTCGYPAEEDELEKLIQVYSQLQKEAAEGPDQNCNN